VIQKAWCKIPWFAGNPKEFCYLCWISKKNLYFSEKKNAQREGEVIFK